MKIVFTLALLLLSSAFSFSQNAQSTPSPQPTPDAPRITLADAKAAFDSKTAVFIDARSADAYKAEHVKGAMSLPYGSDPKLFKELPRDKTLIVYCS